MGHRGILMLAVQVSSTAHCCRLQIPEALSFRLCGNDRPPLTTCVLGLFDCPGCLFTVDLSKVIAQFCCRRAEISIQLGTLLYPQIFLILRIKGDSCFIYPTRFMKLPVIE